MWMRSCSVVDSLIPFLSRLFPSLLSSLSLTPPHATSLFATANIDVSDSIRQSYEELDGVSVVGGTSDRSSGKDTASRLGQLRVNMKQMSEYVSALADVADNGLQQEVRASSPQRFLASVLAI